MKLIKSQLKHSSVFVAGARPFILWVCGFALAYACMLRPLIFDIAMLSGSSFYMPELDDELLSTALFGLLGLGGLRTFEKSKKVARERLIMQPSNMIQVSNTMALPPKVFHSLVVRRVSDLQVQRQRKVGVVVNPFVDKEMGKKKK